MKKTLLLLCLFLGVGTLYAQKTVSVNPLDEIIEDNYAVVKKTPDNPYDITIRIYLKNKDVMARSGDVAVRVARPGGDPLIETEFPVTLPGEDTEIVSYDVQLPEYGDYKVDYVYREESGNTVTGAFSWLTEPVNFFYAFTTPHRLTTGLPDSIGKTLLDFSPGLFSMAWTYDDLLHYPYDSFRSIKSSFRVNIRPELNGKPIEKSTWTRLAGYLPMVSNSYDTDEVSLLLEIGGVEEATVAKVTIRNKSDKPQHVRIPCVYPGNWKGHNLGWIDDTQPTDNLQAGWGGPADQVLVLGVGADEYPLDPVMTSQLNLDWTVPAGESREGFLVRPYNAFDRDLGRLRGIDWRERFDSARARWEELVARASRITLPDKHLENAFYSAITDFFIMREPIAKGYIGVTPGTDVYRTAPNSCEPAHETVGLSQLGLYKEAEEGYRVSWDLQEPDGNWTEPGGWAHLGWATTGFKAWAALEYYLHSRNRAFLEKRFPQMLAASRWQKKMRERTKKSDANGAKELTYGLMPKGMGDGGLKNGDSHYGIFYMHNIFSVFADSLAYKAATILGREEEAAELHAIYQEARTDLLAAMDRGAIVDPDGTRWLSSLPGKETGSSFGLLSSIYPTKILPPGHELMSNTIGRIESNMSPGGIPLHTGFMVDGMWVAMTLNDFAPAHLFRDEPDIASAFLYAAVNHGTPLYSWCEERGQFPGAERIMGDPQHLWTPIAVMRFMRDMLIVEDGNTLHLARGVARSWLGSGESVGIERGSTHFGQVSYQVRYDDRRSRLTGTISFPENGMVPETILYCYLPEGMELTHTDTGTLMRDKPAIRILNGHGTINFEAKVRKLNAHALKVHGIEKE